MERIVVDQQRLQRLFLFVLLIDSYRLIAAHYLNHLRFQALRHSLGVLFLLFLIHFQESLDPLVPSLLLNNLVLIREWTSFQELLLVSLFLSWEHHLRKIIYLHFYLSRRYLIGLHKQHQKVSL